MDLQFNAQTRYPTTRDALSAIMQWALNTYDAGASLAQFVAFLDEDIAQAAVLRRADAFEHIPILGTPANLAAYAAEDHERSLLVVVDNTDRVRMMRINIPPRRSPPTEQN